VTTAMAGLLRSRRGRDLAVLLIIPIFALYEAFTQIVPRMAAEGKITAETFAGIDRWLRWLPPGLAAHAIQDASAGHAGAALLRLGVLAAVIVALGALWIRSLGRALVSVDTSTQSSAVRGRPLPFARSGIRGTVAGRYLIYQRRDPGSFVRWCIVAVVMGAGAVSTIRTPHYHVALIVSAVVGAWMLGNFNSNAIGLIGPAFGLEASALSGVRALRAYLAGRGIALAIIAVPLMTAVSFAIAAVAGHLADGLWVVAIDLAGIGASLAVSSIFTVTLAYPAEKRPGNPMPRAADGYGGRVFAGTFGSLAGVLLATVPVILAVEFTNSVPAAVRIPVLVVGAAGYGLALAWAAAWIAARAAAQRLPELYQLAVRSKL
jgi:ABC-2 type transport system permease protein